MLRRESPLLVRMLGDAAVSRCAPGEMWAEEVRGSSLLRQPLPS